jgi:hypothetical protein
MTSASSRMQRITPERLIADVTFPDRIVVFIVAHPVDPGIVEGAIEPPKVDTVGGDHRLHLVGIAHIAALERSLAASRFDHGNGLRRRLLR